MAENHKPELENTSGPIAFQTEIKELLNILVHSLYTKREIFLRELLSNASDALTQMRFILQTDRDILDPSRNLEIQIDIDPEEKIIRVTDTGIGMTSEEMKTNLGTIAQSGAKAFLEAADGEDKDLVDVIGRFGVGFYSVFMVAEWVKVTSRSYQPDEVAASWMATGADTFEVGTADKSERGTEIQIKLKDDADEFLDVSRLKMIIKTHSDYVPYPIFIGGEDEQINQQSAIWRETPRSVEDSQYHDFYRQLTLDLAEPLEKIHFVADAPLMIYALLFLPVKPDRGLFTLREQDGLKLFSRKILIDDNFNDLLPPYLRFIQGVVDAEDLPLNVSRESIQASAIITRLRKILTNQVIQKLKELANKDEENYLKFWQEFGMFLKEGVAANDEYKDELATLLRFRSTTMPDQWVSLDDYLDHMKPGQEKIYYILGDDENSVSRSPHLDYFQTYCYEVLTLTDPVDSFMLLGLRKYKDFELQNVADSGLDLPEQEDASEADDKMKEPSLTNEDRDGLIVIFKEILGDKVSDVRITNRLTNSIARLVDAEGALGQEMQRVYRMMDRDYQIPKKVLEINPDHPILKQLFQLTSDDPRRELVVEQIFEGTLLIEGLHPDPAAMIPRIQELIKAALDRD